MVARFPKGFSLYFFSLRRIRQIITMFARDQVEAGEVEFF